jgi:UPF0271 protein
LIEVFGDAALRARLPEDVDVDAAALLDSLRRLPGVIDAVVTERHALVTFDPGSPPTEMTIALSRALAAPARTRAPRHHIVRVRYDGPDLEEIALRTGLRRPEMIAVHEAPEYVVASIGFLPGFAYLRGLDSRLCAQRRAVPRARVPRLSVAIAGPYTGVYPCASPGGWHIVGTAIDFSPFDEHAGALLKLGDRVRFVEEPG